MNSHRLVIVSNRVPPPSAISPGDGEGSESTGGMVSALNAAMPESGGLWFGWSGRTAQRRPIGPPAVSRFGGPVELATMDLSEDEVSLYYTGFANRTLWPLLHSFLDRVEVRRDTYRAYRRINFRFAEALQSLLRPGDLVWVHDYHLFHVGRELKQLGWRGKVGFFLHVPFPPWDIFSMLPWSDEILTGLLGYDLVGVHTERYLHNLIDTLTTQFGGTLAKGIFTHGDSSTRLGAYPTGIDPVVFQRMAAGTANGLSEELSIPQLQENRLILGVDRLDYTKGIPERLRAFERLLEHHRSMRGKVSFVQISQPSRTRVPEYIREKEMVDRLVGQINGRFSEGGWVPVRYLYRSFPQHKLARFYRDADICLVTPLRDGMNLVAQEFVASQDDDPGVLVLSQFTGAASFMQDALIVNPYDIDQTAEAIHTALRMPHRERYRRWAALMEAVCGRTARSWGATFTTDLVSS